MKKRWFVLSGVVFLLVALVAALPLLLRLMGLHPNKSGEAYDLAGKKALIVTTSQGTLGDTGKATGVYASEMTIPYYEFIGSGMTVDVASIQGGEIPIEPMSIKWPLATAADKKYLSDSDFQAKVKNSIPISQVDFTAYDSIYLAGGWGAAYDLAQSSELAEGLALANAKDTVLGAVCHGILGLVPVKSADGSAFLEGKKVTAVTNRQLEQLRITATPLHPETEVKAAGALYESSSAFRDIFAYHVVTDGNLVTGQNQNCGQEVAQRMMKLVTTFP